MPTYGVERFIADAVADLLTQTYGDFELIIVDDCSPDRSVEVVETVFCGDLRGRIVHHERNRGLSQARNTGIAEARGDWILFPDPDDRYDEHMLARIADYLERQKTDLVIFGHVQEYYDARGSHLYDNALSLPDATYAAGPELGRAVVELEKQTHLGYAWNKAYRTSIIKQNQLAFKDNAPLIEDILFNVDYLRHANSIATISDMPYRYAKRIASNLTNEFIPNYFELHRQRIRAVRDLVEDLGALDSSAKATLGALYGRYILSAFERTMYPQAHMSPARRLTWLKNVYEDELFCELMPSARADDSASLAVCLKLLNAHNSAALLGIARAIHVVRCHNTTLLTKVKSKR